MEWKTAYNFPQGMKGHPVNMAGATFNIDYSFLTWYDKYVLHYQLHRSVSPSDSLTKSSVSAPGVRLPKLECCMYSDLHARRHTAAPYRVTKSVNTVA